MMSTEEELKAEAQQQKEKGCDEIESKCDLTDRNMCLNIVKNVKKGEPLGIGEETHFLRNEERWFPKDKKGNEYSWCMERSFGGGKSGAFVWQIKIKSENNKDFKFGKNRLPAYAKKSKGDTMAIMKVYIDAFRPTTGGVEKEDGKASDYVVNRTRPFREVYAQCLMSGRKGYNCLLDVFTVGWGTLSDKLFQSIDERDELYGKKIYQLKERKFYKDFEETEKEYFRSLKKNHQVLVMVTTNSCGIPLMNVKINQMSPSMLLGSWLELFSVWQWSTRRMGEEFSHWDFHPDNIFVDTATEVRPSAQFDLDFIKDFLKGPTLPIFANIAGAHVGPERAFLTQIYDVLWGAKMTEIISQFSSLKRIGKSKILEQLSKLETDLTIHFIKKFNDLQDQAFLPCEDFKSRTTGLADPEWCPTDRCERDLRNWRDGDMIECNEAEFDSGSLEKYFSRKTTHRIKESLKETIIILIHNVFVKIKSLLSLNSYFTIAYPRIQLIDFDLVINQRFELLEPEHKNKLNSPVLITERATALLMKWIPLEQALTWIKLLPTILPYEIKGEINLQRGDHAHLLTYALVFATWWLTKRDCEISQPDASQKLFDVAQCPIKELRMSNSAKVVISFFKGLSLDKIMTFLSNPFELIPQLISSNVLAQPKKILSQMGADAPKIFMGSVLELTGDKLNIPGMSVLADFMQVDWSSLLSGRKVFRRAIENKFKAMESLSFKERQEYISYENTTLTIRSPSSTNKLYYLYGSLGAGVNIAEMVNKAAQLAGVDGKNKINKIVQDLIKEKTFGLLKTDDVNITQILLPLFNLLENIGIVLSLPKNLNIDIELPKLDLSFKDDIVISMPFREEIPESEVKKIIKGAVAKMDDRKFKVTNDVEQCKALIVFYDQVKKAWKLRYPFEPPFSSLQKTTILVKEENKSILPGGSWYKTARTCRDSYPIAHHGVKNDCEVFEGCYECESLANPDEWENLSKFHNIVDEDNNINILLQDEHKNWKKIYREIDLRNEYKNDDGYLVPTKQGLLHELWEEDINKKLANWYSTHEEHIVISKLQELTKDGGDLLPGLYLKNIDTIHEPLSPGFSITISNLSVKETFQEIDFDLEITGLKYFITHLIMPLFDSIVLPLLMSVDMDWDGVKNIVGNNMGKILIFISALALVGGVLLYFIGTEVVVDQIGIQMLKFSKKWAECQAAKIPIIATAKEAIRRRKIYESWLIHPFKHIGEKIKDIVFKNVKDKISLVDKGGELTENGMRLFTWLLNHLTPGGKSLREKIAETKETVFAFWGLDKYLPQFSPEDLFLAEKEDNSGLNVKIWNLRQEHYYKNEHDNILCKPKELEKREEGWKTMRVEIRNYDGIPSGIFTCIPALSGNKMTETLDCISAIFPTTTNITTFLHYNWKSLFPNLEIGLKYDYNKNLTRQFTFVQLSGNRIHTFPATKALAHQVETSFQISYTLFKLLYYFLNLQKINVDVNPKGPPLAKKVVDFLLTLLKKMYYFFASFSRFDATKILQVVQWLLFSVMDKLVKAEYEEYYKEIGYDYFDYSSISIAVVAQELLAYFVDLFMEYLPAMMQGDFSEIKIPEDEYDKQQVITVFCKKLGLFDENILFPAQRGGEADSVDWSGGGEPILADWNDAMKTLEIKELSSSWDKEIYSNEIFEPILKILKEHKKVLFIQPAEREKVTIPGGHSYEGAYKDGSKDGSKHGYGVYTWKNGHTYEGAWKDNRMHGYGIQTNDDKMYRTKYDNGNRVSSELIKYDDQAAKDSEFEFVCKNCDEDFLEKNTSFCRECNGLR